MRLKLTHEEALESLKQVAGYVEYARKFKMDGIGYSHDCPVCGDSPYDAETQEMVNMALLMGQSPQAVCQWSGFKPGIIFRHRTHLIKGFWAYGMGARIAEDGHWLTYPKDGTFQDQMKWYRGRFQYLAYQAEMGKDLREQRNCLKEAMSCDRAIELVQRLGDQDPKRALEVPEDLEAKLAEIERRRTQAVIEARPVVEVEAKSIEVKTAEKVNEQEA